MDKRIRCACFCVVIISGFICRCVGQNYHRKKPYAVRPVPLQKIQDVYQVQRLSLTYGSFFAIFTALELVQHTSERADRCSRINITHNKIVRVLRFEHEKLFGVIMSAIGILPVALQE